VCSETFVSSPARKSTPVFLKNKIQQPRRNPYTKPYITIVTQNIRGTQGSKDPQGNTIDLGDIESVVDLMRNRNIDIYLLQETWIYEDIETEIRGITFINHGVKRGINNGGVAILLNKRAQKAWDAAGRPELYKSSTLAGDNTRFLMIELLFNTKKKQSTRIFVASIYAPQPGITAKDPEALLLFHQSLADLFRYSATRKKLSPHEKHYIVMGGDWNASIGTKNPDIDNGNVLGKYGISHVNEAGGKLIEFMQENELRAPHTFFKTKKNQKSATFYDNLRGRRPLTLDFFITSQKLGNLVIDTKVFQPQGGPVSDHHAMRIKIRLTNKMRPNYANAKDRLLQSEPKQPHTYINWSKLNDADILMQYREIIDTILSTDETINRENSCPTNLSTAIMTAAKSILKEPKEDFSDWFKMSAESMYLTRDRLRNAYDEYRKDGSARNKAAFTYARRKHRQCIKKAKNKFADINAIRACEGIRNGNHLGWKTLQIIEKGTRAHHHETRSMTFHDPDTQKVAITDDENLKIIQKYCDNLYNHQNQVAVDSTILEDIRQRPEETELGLTPTSEEVLQALQKMKNNKAPGESGVTTEALKALSEYGKEYIVTMIKAFWENDQKDYNEWKTALLRLLHKKGSKKVLTNYRGLALQDVTARLASYIIALRLNKLVKKNGLTSQFASVGTTDAQYVLRSALQLRREHDLDSHVLFVDLIKAFDTANHEMLFALLKKFGAPTSLIEPIRKLHRDFKLKFKLGTKEVLIDYSTGVKQGDNIAPALFLFLMQGMAECLETKHMRDEKKNPYYFKHPRSAMNGKIKCQSNPTRTKGKDFSFTHTLFVDDTAIVANSSHELLERGEELYHHFKKFGLRMHVGERDTEGNWKPSKSEAMFFPKKNTTYKRPEPMTFSDQNHRLEYTDEFKYLGCILTPDLLDDTEIAKRVNQAKAQIANLSNFFNSRASTWVKKLVFQSIPVNTLLFGCETWTLTDSNKKKISTVYHQGLRKVLGLRMNTVEKHRNEHVRNKLGVPHILYIVTKRQHDFLGKIADMHISNLQRQFLGAWIPKPRPIGAPKYTMRHTHTEALRSTLGEEVITTPHANLAEWIKLTADRSAWKRLSTDWLNRQQRLTECQFGHHPRLGEPIKRPPCVDGKSHLNEACSHPRVISPMSKTCTTEHHNKDTKSPSLNAQSPHTSERASLIT
jgi:hypothetical protein